MEYTEGKIGRVFLIRLQDGDKIPDCIEEFAEKKNIKLGHVSMIGGIGSGKIVVGPRDSYEQPPKTMSLPIDGAHETVATGTIVPNEQGNPKLHIHGALGRAGITTTGCLRKGVYTWVYGEVIIYEILAEGARRAYDKETEFTLLKID